MTQRKAEREDQLLETATRLFRGKGYHNTSMQDLADHLGLQQSNLDFYADGKEGLLHQLLARATTILSTLIDELHASDLPQPKSSVAPRESQAVATIEPPALVAISVSECRNLPPKRLKEALAVRTH